VRQPIAIEPDSETEQLIAYAEDLPQLPFGDLELHLPETVSGPLTSPTFCGEYETLTGLLPWSGAPLLSIPSTLEIVSGPSEGPCPSEEEEGEEEEEERLSGAGQTESLPATSAAPPNTSSPPTQNPRPRHHRCRHGKRWSHLKGHCVKRRHRTHRYP